MTDNSVSLGGGLIVAEGFISKLDGKHWIYVHEDKIDEVSEWSQINTKTSVYSGGLGVQWGKENQDLNIHILYLLVLEFYF